ncbi:MAG: helix-turn-helix domain-containing protein [Halobacteriales archaeon]
MARDGEGHDLVSVISRRLGILRTLRRPRDKRQLVETLDLSRSTVDRAIRRLESLGLVTRDERYRLTAAGRIAVDRFEEFTDDLEDVVESRELLTALPPDAPVGMSLLRDADVHLPAGPTPTEPIRDGLERVRDADRFHLMIRQITLPEGLSLIKESVTEAGTSARCVLARTLVEHLRQDDDTWLADMVETPECELRVVDRLPYTLGTLRDADGRRTTLIVYGPEGNLRGVVDNDTFRAFAWGETVFQKYYGNAEPLDAVG